MEQLKKLATRGIESDVEALEQLDLGLIDYPDLENITQEQLNRLYGQTAIIRSAAQTVNRMTTVDCAKNLMELLYYLSQTIFKSTVQYTITVDEVLREMLTQVTSIRDFCLKVGEEKETSVHVKALNWHIQKTRDAIGGDLMSAHDLGLKKLPSLKIRAIKQTPSMETLFRSFGSAAELATAGWYIGDESLKKVSCCTVVICELIQQRLHPRSEPLKVRIFGSDACESLVALIQEIEQSVAKVNEKIMKEVVEEYSDREREFVEEEKDPSYSPEAEEQEEEDEDEDEDVVAPSPQAASTASKKKSQKCTDREKNVMALPTETAQSASTRKRKATSAWEDEPNEKAEREATTRKECAPYARRKTPI